MSDHLLIALTFGTALGCGLIAGAFFAFSAFVMKALARIEARCGIAAMQSINVVVINPAFMAIFLGSAAGCLILGVESVLHWDHPGAAWRAAGAVLYLVGTFLVTIAFNVPRNNALARLDPTSPDAKEHWRRYVRTWTRWNHVRTIASLAAAAGFMAALLRRAIPIG